MESYITIKATPTEMKGFFDENEVCSVRHYEFKGKGYYDVRIRHAERKQHLNGVYTISELIAKLKQ